MEIYVATFMGCLFFFPFLKVNCGPKSGNKVLYQSKSLQLLGFSKKWKRWLTLVCTLLKVNHLPKEFQIKLHNREIFKIINLFELSLISIFWILLFGPNFSYNCQKKINDKIQNINFSNKLHFQEVVSTNFNTYLILVEDRFCILAYPNVHLVAVDYQNWKLLAFLNVKQGR